MKKALLVLVLFLCSCTIQRQEVKLNSITSNINRADITQLANLARGIENSAVRNYRR